VRFTKTLEFMLEKGEGEQLRLMEDLAELLDAINKGKVNGNLCALIGKKVLEFDDKKALARYAVSVGRREPIVCYQNGLIYLAVVKQNGRVSSVYFHPFNFTYS